MYLETKLYNEHVRAYRRQLHAVMVCDVLRDWMANRVSLVEGAQRLTALGYNPLDAFALLERT
jgi:hypothetical protein